LRLASRLTTFAQLPDAYYGANATIVPDIYHAGRGFYTFFFATRFETPSAAHAALSRFSLLFRGVNYSLRAWLNGSPVALDGPSEGMYLPKRGDVSALLLPESASAANTLCLLVEPPPHVEVVGYLEPEARDDMLRGARALLAPTHYNEPFGGVTIEALLCGTPIITSDWGAFAENNLHGVTGYRCRTIEQFVWAANNIGKISRAKCRQWAAKNFSLERIGAMYEEYFTSLLTLYTGKGFYQENPGRTELDWLKREYPC
jgi:glycosyltransferase involved in cell wall biosynthesis